MLGRVRSLESEGSAKGLLAGRRQGWGRKGKDAVGPPRRGLGPGVFC